MADRISEEQRSYNMSRIRNKETTIEVKVRKWLYHNGVRYRKNNNKIRGTPDISIKKYKLAIFINGCFWHGHDSCKLATVPKTNTEFWLEKVRKNKERDQRVARELEEQGWKVIVVWECQLGKNFEDTMNKLLEEIRKTIEQKVEKDK